MAVVTEVTISTGSTVETGAQAREVGIALTYRLEREDSDVMQMVREKAAEVARAHQVAWKSIRDEQVASIVRFQKRRLRRRTRKDLRTKQKLNSPQGRRSKQSTP
jgi:hypothetical protein